MNRKSQALLLLLSLTGGIAQAGQYTQTAGSRLNFSGSYQGEAFSGQFPGFVSTLVFDPKQLANAKLDVRIPLASATTRNADYDTELRGNAFFNSGQFPQARYTARKFRALGGNRFAADGILNLRGINKPVTLQFTWTGGARPVLNGTAVVRRLDFNVGSGDWADLALIPNDIKVSTQLVLQAKP